MRYLAIAALCLVTACASIPTRAPGPPKPVPDCNRDYAPIGQPRTACQ